MILVSLEQSLLQQTEETEDWLEIVDRWHSIGWWYFQKVCANQGADPQRAMTEFMFSIGCAAAHLANVASPSQPGGPGILEIHHAVHTETTAMQITSAFIFFGVLVEGGFLNGLDFNFDERTFQVWRDRVFNEGDATVQSLFGIDDSGEIEGREMEPRTPPSVDLPLLPSGDVPEDPEGDGDGKGDE